MASEQELIALLEYLGCQKLNHKESKDDMGARILCTCPMHDDSSPSFMVRTDYPHVYNCYVCGGGKGLVKLVQESMLHSGVSYKKALAITGKYVDLTQHTLIKPFKTRTATEPPPLDPSVLWAYKGQLKTAHKYLATRGILKVTCEHHDIGYDRHQKRVVCPIKNRTGMIVGFVGRTTIDRDKLRRINNARKNNGRNPIPPYLVYNNAPREFMMLGIHHIKRGERLYVVEGYIDYLTLRQWGYLNVVCLLGSHASEWHMEQFIKYGVKELALFVDNDAAGADAAIKIYNRMKDELLVLVPQYQDGDGDPDEMGAKRFKELADSMVPVHTVRLAHFD